MKEKQSSSRQNKIKALGKLYLSIECSLVWKKLRAENNVLLIEIYSRGITTKISKNRTRRNFFFYHIMVLLGKVHSLWLCQSHHKLKFLFHSVRQMLNQSQHNDLIASHLGQKLKHLKNCTASSERQAQILETCWNKERAFWISHSFSETWNE